MSRILWAEKRKEIRDAAKKAKVQNFGIRLSSKEFDAIIDYLKDSDGTTVDRPVRPTDVPQSQPDGHQDA
jgi:hypothetical protein